MIFQYFVIDEIFFKGVYCLLEGYFFCYKNGEFLMEQYWDVDFFLDKESFNQVVDKIEVVVDELVKVYFFVDVGIKVGFFLLVGVDFFYVMVMMCFDNIFLIGFDFCYDEIKQVCELVEKLKLKNIDKKLINEEVFNVFLIIQYYLDELDFNLFVVLLYFLIKLVKDNGYKVMLFGEGVDEFFVGYIDYGFNIFFKLICWVIDQMCKLL